MNAGGFYTWSTCYMISPLWSPVVWQSLIYLLSVALVLNTQIRTNKLWEPFMVHCKISFLDKCSLRACNAEISISGLHFSLHITNKMSIISQSTDINHGSARFCTNQIRTSAIVPTTFEFGQIWWNNRSVSPGSWDTPSYIPAPWSLHWREEKPESHEAHQNNFGSRIFQHW